MIWQTTIYCPDNTCKYNSNYKCQKDFIQLEFEDQEIPSFVCTDYEFKSSIKSKKSNFALGEGDNL